MTTSPEAKLTQAAVQTSVILRDRFAIAALQCVGRNFTTETTVRVAYEIADAMLAESVRWTSEHAYD